MFISEDLPDPFAPARPTHSSAPISKLIPVSTWSPPMCSPTSSHNKAGLDDVSGDQPSCNTLNRLCYLQLLDLCIRQTQYIPEYKVIVLTDFWTRSPYGSRVI